MANLIMQSFQNATKASDIGWDDAFSFEMQPGGRDGLKYAYVGVVNPLPLITINTASSLFVGFRLYKIIAGHIDSNLSIRFYFDEIYTEIKLLADNLLVCPDNSLHMLKPPCFLEFGMNEQYFEVRIDAKTIYQELSNILPDSVIMRPETISGKYCMYIGMLDLYVNNAEGTTNNSFLGDVKVNVYPIISNGSLSTGFVSSTGGPLYEAVNEIPVNINDWIEGVNIGDKVTFQLADLPENEVPLSVKVSTQASKMSVSGSGIQLLSKIGENIYKSDKISLPIEGSKISSVIYSQSPGGIPWNRDDVNALEIGMEIVP